LLNERVSENYEGVIATKLQYTWGSWFSHLKPDALAAFTGTISGQSIKTPYTEETTQTWHDSRHIHNFTNIF